MRPVAADPATTMRIRCASCSSSKRFPPEPLVLRFGLFLPLALFLSLSRFIQRTPSMYPSCVFLQELITVLCFFVVVVGCELIVARARGGVGVGLALVDGCFRFVVLDVLFSFRLFERHVFSVLHNAPCSPCS